jgi:UDP-N-acetylglucosamine acyltransferase
MIHETVIVHDPTNIGVNVTIGPYSIIGPNVSIGDNCDIGSHTIIEGRTSVGANTKISSFAAIGGAPQHSGYMGEDTTLEIGENNVIREYCTINRGTVEGGSLTSIGDNNFLMAYAHIAHDCHVGSNTIFANAASLAGHVHVGDYAVMGGFSLVHQYCRVGAHCITGIGAVCLLDVPPYMIVAGNKAVTHGINVKGLRRRDFTEEDILVLKRAYKTFYRSDFSMEDGLSKLEVMGDNPHLVSLISFLRSTERGVIR